MYFLGFSCFLVRVHFYRISEWRLKTYCYAMNNLPSCLEIQVLGRHYSPQLNESINIVLILVVKVPLSQHVNERCCWENIFENKISTINSLSTLFSFGESSLIQCWRSSIADNRLSWIYNPGFFFVFYPWLVLRRRLI